MPIPKQRHTKSRRNNRRSHIALKSVSFSACPKCGQLNIPHRVCSNCGVYKGMEVVDVMKDLNKKERKRKEKELKAQEQEAQANS